MNADPQQTNIAEDRRPRLLEHLFNADICTTEYYVLREQFFYSKYIGWGTVLVNMTLELNPLLGATAGGGSRLYL
jgi:hypothetical protein